MASILVIGARGIPDVEGGAEKNAEELFPRLVEAGHAVTLLSLEKNVRAPTYRGVKLLPAPTFWLLKTDKLIYYCAGIFYAARQRPDIVHLQGLGAALFLWVYKLLGLRVVVRYGSADYVLAKWGLVGKAGFLAAEFQLRFANAVISVSDTLTRRLNGHGITSRVHSIPNALDAPEPQWPGWRHGRPYILAVGRVTFQKNIDTLLKAFSLLSVENPDFDLRIVGSLSDTAYVASLSALTTPHVIMTGAAMRSEVPQQLSECALYVNLSHHEGNSNATLEAISHGCPVLVSDLPENREMPLMPENFVDRHDVDAIVAAFKAALTNPERFVVNRAGFLNWDDVARKTNSVYLAIL
ncbi:glycosyltransferase family 4 protein [Devosia faecipullorum]|uniref:glycosyltransferase family 4 protein n=1 Tax=Devosia faecipullorum TaxID=2755039 RepID=UPI00187B9971|nr:glycosyltransferase family 4 protein [Devosia faecipullorum]MBE7731963.1 glycosyltransferase family 4 protein [Devosia faecipullorum]